MRYTLHRVTGFLACIACLLITDVILAQNPIVNAQQFQEKAVKAALKGSKRQSFKPKNDNIEWVNGPAPASADKADKSEEDISALPVNIGE